LTVADTTHSQRQTKRVAETGSICQSAPELTTEKQGDSLIGVFLLVSKLCGMDSSLQQSTLFLDVR